MRRTFLTIIAAVASMTGMQATAAAVTPQAVIPQPAEIIITDGSYSIPGKWKVNSSLPVDMTEKLLGELKRGYELTGSGANLHLKENKEIGAEGYQLNVDGKGVTISASTEKGFYYGLQTLKQLGRENGIEKGSLPYCSITDYPRFEHRALMLDVARYFIPKEEVKKIIDQMSSLKLNRLHMHLTDDNGWRLEIKRYPKLTEVGAWRVDRPEYFPGRKNPTNAEEPTPVGGFYTQEDIKELVKYAADKHIEIIPEIEMPAHAAAAIASYPELACPVVEKFVGVFPGIGGPDASIIMCGGNEQVYDFYKGVIDEVTEIFPSKYIHLGGDEAEKSNWQNCPLCIAKVEEEKLDGFEGLQAYFMDRINNYVREKGKTAMGWDEVTYGNPKEEMVILGWQGDGGVAVRDARKSGRKFIMTPALKLYLIRYQGPQWFEPVTYFGNNTLEDAYSYEAVQPDWTPELKDQLLGIQGSIWTEFCRNNEDVEYLLFPRLIGVADAAWRPEGSGDFAAFAAALDNYLPLLDENGVTYAKSMYNIQHKVIPTGNGLAIEMKAGRPDLEILYTTEANGRQKEYSAPIEVTAPTVIRANTYQDGKEKGKELTLDLNFNKATGKNVRGNSRNGLDGVLTNGLRGTDKHSDFEWAGWFGDDAEFVIDLGETTDVNGVTLGMIANSDFIVAMPSEVELLISDDGENYRTIAKGKTPEEKVYAKQVTRHDLEFGSLKEKGRYLKFKARNPGRIPEGYARAGTPAWLYFDEVIVE